MTSALQFEESSKGKPVGGGISDTNAKIAGR
jgi:hypothetical protein